MSKAAEKLILWLWISTTSFLNFSLMMYALPTIAQVNYFSDGTFYRNDNVYSQPIYVIVINQIVVSGLFLLGGLVWSAIVLIGSERLLVFLRIPTPGNNKFSHFSLGLFKFALSAIVFAILIGNIGLIYDQVQGRGRLGAE
jgi:hypothetical protein